MHHHRNAASNFDVFDGTPHFGFAFGKSLTIFLSDDSSEVIDVTFQQLLQLEERLDAVFRRSASPIGERSSSGFDRRTNVARIGQRHFRQSLASRGIDDIEPFTGIRFGPFAINVILNLGFSDDCRIHDLAFRKRQRLRHIVLHRLRNSFSLLFVRRL